MMDLLVIGAGLSGLSAALVAAHSGLTVRIVAKGMGAHHWCTGSVDVLGYREGESPPIDAPFDAITQLVDSHPYQIAGAQRADAFLAQFRELAELDVLGYSARPDQTNWMLPTATGALRPTWLAPMAQAKGANLEGSEVVVVGVEGLRDFYPHLVAENLARQGWKCRAASVPWSAVSECADRNAIQLAEGLDRPSQTEALAAALRSVVRPGESAGLPAILGLERHGDIVAELERATRATVFEIPLLPPSVPGIRLYRQVRSRLSALGVRIEAHMEAIGFGVEDGRVAWVETETSSRPLRHRARAFLLATGGILGGGFDSDHTGRVWDPVFGLPLNVPQKRSEWFTPHFMEGAGQPVFTGGVRVSGNLQPMDETGKVVYTNLWAAGGCLAGADPIRERSLEGIAIATGVAAAREITAVIGDW